MPVTRGGKKLHRVKLADFPNLRICEVSFISLANGCKGIIGLFFFGNNYLSKSNHLFYVQVAVICSILNIAKESLLDGLNKRIHELDRTADPLISEPCVHTSDLTEEELLLMENVHPLTIHTEIMKLPYFQSNHADGFEVSTVSAKLSPTAASMFTHFMEKALTFFGTFNDDRLFTEDEIINKRRKISEIYNDPGMLGMSEGIGPKAKKLGFTEIDFIHAAKGLYTNSLFVFSLAGFKSTYQSQPGRNPFLVEFNGGESLDEESGDTYHIDNPDEMHVLLEKKAQMLESSMRDDFLKLERMVGGQLRPKTIYHIDIGVEFVPVGRTREENGKNAFVVNRMGAMDEMKLALG